MHHFRNLKHTDLHTKDDGSPVTLADTEIHTYLAEKLATDFPECQIVSEEGAELEPASEKPLWIIDPIDSTKNFVEGNPHFAISIALWSEGVIQLGAVYAPAEEKLFSSQRGTGAYLQGERVHASECASLKGARVLLDHGVHSETMRTHAAIRQLLLEEGALVESLDCASLDMCLVAEGKYDARIHCRNQVWDIAAGVGTAEEAGAVVTDMLGNKKDIFTPGVIVSTPGIHSALVALVQKASTITPSL